MNRDRLLKLQALALMSFLLGCGGSDEGSGELTKQAFLKEGNSICQKGVQEKDALLKAGFEKIAGRGGKEPSQKDFEGLVLDALRPIATTTAQLRELKPPSEDEDTVRAFEQEYEQALEEAEEDPKVALAAGFLQGPNEAAQGYGLKYCNL